MKQKTLIRLLAALCAVFSLVGLILRAGQLASELQPDGTLAPGSARHIYLAVLTVVWLLVLIGLLLRLAPRARAAQVLAPRSPVFWGYYPAAALLALGAIWSAFSGTSAPTVMGRIVAVLEPLVALAAAVCMALLARRCLEGKRPSPLLYMCQSLYLALRLVVQFQGWNTDPSLHDYCFSLLTLICAMLSAFQLAGFCFDRGKRRLCLFWTLCAVYFQSISLADAFKNGGGADKLSALGLWLLLAFGAWQLLHARGAQRRVRPPLTLPDEAEPAAPSEAAQEAQELPDIREET